MTWLKEVQEGGTSSWKWISRPVFSLSSFSLLSRYFWKGVFEFHVLPFRLRWRGWSVPVSLRSEAMELTCLVFNP